MIEQDTIKLLRECDAGVKMGISSIDDVLDHVKKEEIERLQRVPFGPLMVTAPQNLEGFLRRNYPSLHRFTPEEVATVNTHYPHQLSFNTDAE